MRLNQMMNAQSQLQNAAQGAQGLIHPVGPSPQQQQAQQVNNEGMN